MIILLSLNMLFAYDADIWEGHSWLWLLELKMHCKIACQCHWMRNYSLCKRVCAP